MHWGGAESVGVFLVVVVVVVVVIVVVVVVVVFAVVALFLVYLFVRVPFLVGRRERCRVVWLLTGSSCGSVP